MRAFPYRFAVMFGVLVSRGPSPIVRAAAPEIEGQWGEVLQLDFQCIHMVLLKNGNILAISEDGTIANEVRLWTPPDIDDPDPFHIGTLDVVTPPTVAGTGSLMVLYCAGHAPLKDGRVLLAGGGFGPPGHDHTVIFDPDAPISDPWTVMLDMPCVPDPQDPNLCMVYQGQPVKGLRWYPTCTTLADGTVLVMGGDKINDVIHRAEIPLIFDPYAGPQGQYTRILNGERHFPYYPNMFLLSDQYVFYAAYNPNNWPYADEGLPDNQRMIPDPDLGTWKTVVPDPTRGSTTAMIWSDLILKAGSSSSSLNRHVYTMDPTQFKPMWTRVADLNIGRRTFNLVVLPGGDVLAIGGRELVPGTGLEKSVEKYDPDTDTWAIMDEMTYGRAYHSTTLLLPDGRVAVAGNDLPEEPVSALTAQIYSPPYLFQGERPLVMAPSAVQYNTKFQISTSIPVDKACLIGLGANTHSFDQNQRYVALPLLGTAPGGTYLVAAPVDGYRAPPGYYMFFALANGVPSEAVMMKIE